MQPSVMASHGSEHSDGEDEGQWPGDADAADGSNADDFDDDSGFWDDPGDTDIQVGGRAWSFGLRARASVKFLLRSASQTTNAHHAHLA